MGETIRTATPPNMIGNPNIPLFEKDRFESEIFNKGYDVIIEHAVVCPCKGTSGSAKTSCKNCLGLGWVFVNPLKTKVIASSINHDTKFKYWSPELTGTVNLTARDEERFSYMDKVIFVGSSNIFSEIRPIVNTGGEKFIFTSYRVKAIRSIFMFEADNAKLVRLTADKYSVKPENLCVVELTGFTLPANNVLSIDYEAEVSYNVIDQPHDFRSSFSLDDNGKIAENNMPVQAIARKSHIVLGFPTNFAGDNLLNNDWQPEIKMVPTYTVTQPTVTVKTANITVTYPLQGTGFEYSVDDGITYSLNPSFGVPVNAVYKIVVRKISDKRVTAPITITINQIPAPAAPVISVTAQPTVEVPTGTLEVSSPLGVGYEYSLTGSTYQSSPVFAGLAPNANYTVRCRFGGTPPVSAVSNIVTVNTVPI